MTIITDYIKSAPAEQQEYLEIIYQIAKETLPDATEKMSYGMPTFHQGENIVHFAGMKKHLGFYPTPSAISAFSEALSPYKTSKGAVQFPYTKPLPRTLIQEMIAFRKNELHL
ncbi:hypothetical protein BAU15_07180 [Enterococcus sp. JM4C]|uniref:iron chaperone n=1 Tax=Candidatus Enterococcus huntleyi TaxID=1857217 RepID=UPI001379AA4F|nr:DUF1801 domain-containing protein [Enterococcus sp. JM4C]KAF1297490.1 hypothetical protein BAU15_07180 [Enterococcus sp. JM4C]